MLPEPHHLRQPRRHRAASPARPRRRRPRLVAAALPRHGPGGHASCSAPPPGSTWCSAPRRTSWPSRPLDGVALHYGGTATAGPNFAYALAARALRRVRPRPVAAAGRPQRRRAGRPGHRARRSSTAGAPRHAPRRRLPGLRHGGADDRRHVPRTRGRAWCTDCVDRRVLETERYAAPVDASAEGARRARPARSSGRPRDAHRRPDTGNELAEREVGELQIRGTSVTPGYYGDPEATRASSSDGWLHTGDLAYLVDGELVVCGRIKDVIIVGGRNVFPEDVERAHRRRRRRARRQRDRLRHRRPPRQGGPRRRGREQGRRPRRVRRAVARRSATSGFPPRTSCWSPPARCPRPPRANSNVRSAAPLRRRTRSRLTITSPGGHPAGPPSSATWGPSLRSPHGGRLRP